MGRKSRKPVPPKGARETNLPPPETTDPTPGTCIACRNKGLIMPLTEMCGPCTFGEADTIDGW